MSSPNEDQVPPPDPSVTDQHAPPNAPPEDAPPPAAPQTPEPATAAEDGQQQQTPPPPGTQNQHRHPLSSISFFIPFPSQQGSNNNNEGGEETRMGMAWTVDVFPNDGPESDTLEGMGGGATGSDGGDAAQRETAPGGNAADEPSDGPAVEQGGEQARPHGPERPNAPAMERTFFLFVGPEGQRPSGRDQPPDFNLAPGTFGWGRNGGQPAIVPFWFPFFAPSRPPPPDPAKAAELLASLPTIGSALLRRVDKVLVAEDAAGGKEDDDRGWRCGICLDGLETDADSPPSAHPVKGLPCNHLFHEQCLQPWFTSHHTCPTCRLDLDPLRTLHPPRETRSNPLRPAATGAGRATPRTNNHPYARDRETRRSRPQTPANPTPEATPEARATEQNPPQQPQEENQDQTTAQAQPQGPPPLPGWPPGGLPGLNELLHTVFAQATAAVFGELVQGGQGGQAGEGGQGEQGGPAVQGGPMFANGMTDSPTPMDRSASVPTGSSASRAEQTSPTSPPLPSTSVQVAQGESSSSNAQALGAGQEHQAAAGPSRAGPELVRPTPERRPHFHFMPRRPLPPTSVSANGRGPASETPTASAAPMGAVPSDANGAPEDGASPIGNHRVTFSYFEGGGPPGDRPDLGGPTPANARSEASTPSQRAFVPQSLCSWTEQREKTLGWRCDAVECLVASPMPDETSEEMDVDEVEDDSMLMSDKEMLSIYTPLQPPFNPASAEQSAHPAVDFVLLACPHRWHRTCLETAERSAGHSALPDADGREWVRCQKCRKEGWVTPRSEPTAPILSAA